MSLYILSMERDGDREGHHYNVGIYSCLAQATIDGLEHEMNRAGKYEMRIEFGIADSEKNLKEVPREVALSYAIVKHPEKFDVRKMLKES